MATEKDVPFFGRRGPMRVAHLLRMTADDLDAKQQAGGQQLRDLAAVLEDDIATLADQLRDMILPNDPPAVPDDSTAAEEESTESALDVARSLMPGLTWVGDDGEVHTNLIAGVHLSARRLGRGGEWWVGVTAGHPISFQTGPDLRAVLGRVIAEARQWFTLGVAVASGAMPSPLSDPTPFEPGTAEYMQTIFGVPLQTRWPRHNLECRWNCPKCGRQQMRRWETGTPVERAIACSACGETVPAVDALGQPLPEVAP